MSREIIRCNGCGEIFFSITDCHRHVCPNHSVKWNTRNRRFKCIRMRKDAQI